MRNLFVFLIFLMASFTSHAHGPRTQQVQAWVVGTYLSEPGETREQFIVRVAHILQTWTDETGNEACGYLARNDENWGVRVTTQKAQTVCFFASSVVPDGMTVTSDTIHSHPTPNNGHLLITNETIEVLRSIGDRALVKRINQANRRLRVQVDGFSQDDYSAGPGFLVVNRRLYYQAGRGTQVDMGLIDDQTLAIN